MKSKTFKKPKKCPKTGKSMFHQEQSAARAMFRIWSHDSKSDIYDLHTYVCEFCDHWHVGHKSYYAKELAKVQGTQADYVEIDGKPVVITVRPS